jgi:hypothetical protein
MSDNENLLAEARVSLHRGVASKYAWEVFANLVAALEQADRCIASERAKAIKGLLPKGAEFFPEDGGIVFEGKVYFPADYVLSRRDIAAISEAAWDKAMAHVTETFGYENGYATWDYKFNPFRGEQA